MVVDVNTVLKCGCPGYSVKVYLDGTELTDVQSVDVSTGVATVISQPARALPDMSGIVTHELKEVTVKCAHGEVT